MFWDIAIAVLGAVVQFVTAYLGWHVTLTPPAEEKKPRYEVLFVACGLVGIILIAFGTYRAIAGNESLKLDIGELRKSQQKTDTGISQIEKNTHQPPIVNVPAPIITLPTPVSSAKARLDFMFYPNNLNDAPMQTIDAHVVANFVTVGVTAKASKAQAEKGQVWIQICDLCKYAEEPKDSTAPPDDPTVRRKRFDVLHVGALFENTKLQVIPPPGKPFFTISLKYTCENCPPVDNDHPQRLKVNLIRP